MAPSLPSSLPSSLPRNPSFPIATTSPNKTLPSEEFASQSWLLDVTETSVDTVATSTVNQRLKKSPISLPLQQQHHQQQQQHLQHMQLQQQQQQQQKPALPPKRPAPSLPPRSPTDQRLLFGGGNSKEEETLEGQFQIQ